ncbi:hypothetical protein IJ090_02430 [Candidatus Saccharibacteria bacterium]|nr:hypothetical protein [Candidatus Saccharibacteria bacterium]
MEVLVDVLVVLLAALTGASLQLGTGTLLLLYHEGLGRKVPKRVRRAASGYIFGVLIFTILLLATAVLLMLLWFGEALNEDGLIFLASLCIVMAGIVILFYYRRGKTTMLWIPNFMAKYFKKRAGKVETGAEGMALGMTATLGELPFSIILILVAANSLLGLPRAGIIIAIVAYALITIMPILITKMLIKSGRTLADIQRWRVKNKMFFRIFTGVMYLILAIFLVAFKVIKGAA